MRLPFPVLADEIDIELKGAVSITSGTCVGGNDGAVIESLRVVSA